jgi:hypothetical protein
VAGARQCLDLRKRELARPVVQTDAQAVVVETGVQDQQIGGSIAVHVAQQDRGGCVQVQIDGNRRQEVAAPAVDQHGQQGRVDEAAEGQRIQVAIEVDVGQLEREGQVRSAERDGCGEGPLVAQEAVLSRPEREAGRAKVSIEGESPASRAGRALPARPRRWGGRRSAAWM